MRQVLLTSAGLTETMKRLFLAQIGKPVQDIRIIIVPNAALHNDSAREGLSITMAELMHMGIAYANMFLYDLTHLLSENYVRTYSAGVDAAALPPDIRLLTEAELAEYDAILFTGGNALPLLDEVTRTGFGKALTQAVDRGLFYIGVSAGSMIAAGNLPGNLGFLPNPVLPHCAQGAACGPVPNEAAVCLTDQQAVWIHGQQAEIIA